MTAELHEKDIEERRLEERVARQVDRMKRAEQERRTLLGETIFLGTLGLLFVVPVVAGAYLGRWLDSRLEGYAIHWTISLIFLGIVVGAVNVYLFIRE
ncbi:MAG: AtpZ/AtpI family protein [Burkholderiales bacterium]